MRFEIAVFVLAFAIFLTGYITGIGSVQRAVMCGDVGRILGEGR